MKVKAAIVCLPLALSGCAWVPAPTLGPGPLPMPAPAPVCGFRDLGYVGCSSWNGPIAALRAAADWDAYANANCWDAAISAPPYPRLTALDGFDFGAETVLVLNKPSGSYGSNGRITSVCVSSSEVVVEAVYGGSDAMSPKGSCASHAAAIPATNKPVRWTLCVTYGPPGPGGSQNVVCSGGNIP